MIEISILIGSHPHEKETQLFSMMVQWDTEVSSDNTSRMQFFSYY